MRSESTGLPVVSRQAASTDATRHSVDAASGFTLLETLVALAILAIVFVSLFDAHAIALRNIRAASDYAKARILGQALLADSVSGWSRVPVSGTGASGQFHWAINVAEERAPWALFQTKKNWRLYRVAVNVSWDKNRHIVLDTLKLGASK